MTVAIVVAKVPPASAGASARAGVVAGAGAAMGADGTRQCPRPLPSVAPSGR